VLRYRLYVLAAALLFSTGGAAIKATSLPGWQVGSLRSMIAGLVILAVLPESRRKWTGAVWIAGVFYALTLALFAIATKLTTAASAIFLQATAPLYMLVIGPLFLHEKLRRRDVGLSAAAGVGLLLFFFDPAGASATAPEPLQGNIYAATTGFTWALTVTAMRWMARNRRTWHWWLWGTCWRSRLRSCRRGRSRLSRCGMGRYCFIWGRYRSGYRTTSSRKE
jgi:drug/metabolite transporter, DME family